LPDSRETSNWPASDLALLLHRREHGLERRVGEVLRREEREDVRDADPVVGAERRAVGRDELIVDDEAQGLVLEVELDTLGLLAHHVEVAVEDERRGVLEPALAGLADEDAVGVILRRLEAMGLGEPEDPVRDLLLVAAPAGDAREHLEELEHLAGLEVGENAGVLRLHEFGRGHGGFLSLIT